MKSAFTAPLYHSEKRTMYPDEISGVYEIRNTVTGECYVGSTKRSIRRRFKRHREDLSLGIHVNPHLQASWNKYQPKAFQFHVFMFCPAEICREEEQDRINWHLLWGDRLYNIRLEVTRFLGIPCSEAKKKRLSEAMKMWYQTPEGLEEKKKISERMRGRQASEETRAKISAAKSGVKYSVETKRKVGTASKRFWDAPGTKERMAQIRVDRNITVSKETRKKMARSRRSRNKTKRAIRKCIWLLNVRYWKRLLVLKKEKHKGDIGAHHQ